MPCLLATIAWAAWRGGRGDPAARMGALLAGCFVLYSAALVLAYVALFPGTMGSDAHSYFRYSTHLSLLLMAALVLLLRERVPPLLARRRVAPRGLPSRRCSRRRWRSCPICASTSRRRRCACGCSAKQAAPLLPPRERVALVLPGDTGSVAPMLETVLRTAPPRRPALDIKVVTAPAPDTLDHLTAEGYQFAIVSCVPSGYLTAPQGSAAILEHTDVGWHELGCSAIRPRRPAAGRTCWRWRRSASAS